MPETTNPIYEALLTLSLPGQGESVSVTIKLSPADSITTSGRTKRLRDCTLADLQGYAEALEKEVWDTYETISLLDLTEDDMVVLKITLIDKADEQVPDWAEQLVILPDEALQAVDTVGEEIPNGVAGDELLQSSGQILETSEEEQESVTEEAAETAVVESPEVSVAETEPVFPDIDDETVELTEPREVVRPSFPEIIPSKARVRVAGKQLVIGHPTWAAVDILIDEPAFRAAQAHALSSMQREVAGVLIGPRPEKQPDGRYLVHIFDTIIAKHTVMHGASVTYTPESWRYLNDTLSERYPDETAVMVGWYHTHPGFGIFLSGMDQFIHQNFFTQIWHVAMVLDPRARTSGFFCWDRQKTNVSRCEFPWPNWAPNSW